MSAALRNCPQMCQMQLLFAQRVKILLFPFTLQPLQLKIMVTIMYYMVTIMATLMYMPNFSGRRAEVEYRCREVGDVETMLSQCQLSRFLEIG